MRRVDETLQTIEERLGRIEDKLEQPRRVILGAAGSTLGRGFFIVMGVALTYIATKFNLPPF